MPGRNGVHRREGSPPPATSHRCEDLAESTLLGLRSQAVSKSLPSCLFGFRRDRSRAWSGWCECRYVVMQPLRLAGGHAVQRNSQGLASEVRVRGRRLPKRFKRESLHLHALDHLEGVLGAPDAFAEGVLPIRVPLHEGRARDVGNAPSGAAAAAGSVRAAAAVRRVSRRARGAGRSRISAPVQDECHGRAWRWMRSRRRSTAASASGRWTAAMVVSKCGDDPRSGTKAIPGMGKSRRSSGRRLTHSPAAT
ncbi:hypothetical protein SAMN05216268_13158 [Streptomyces yunnanensis]|uniref:Uncharacterized protein n=1 Tax=Streptomyces yunnanensis TaxID=156453 RepID=A0A9X8N8S2_9ACTN|nr:hypothetical protein SAMN05216268_13158 [Streptomyces yunnanensis]